MHKLAAHLGLSSMRCTRVEMYILFCTALNSNLTIMIMLEPQADKAYLRNLI